MIQSAQSFGHYRSPDATAIHKRDTHESEFFQPDYQAGGNLLHRTVHPESVCDLHEVSARLSRPYISRLMSAHNPRSVVILRDVQA